MKEQNYKVISANEAAKMCGISRGSVINLEKDGSFPTRVMITSKRFVYRLPEVEAWLNSRIAERDIDSSANTNAKEKDND